MIPVLEQIRVPRAGAGRPRTCSAATAVTCDDAKSSTPSRSRGTSAPTADAVAVRAVGRPASTGRSTAAVMKWRGLTHINRLKSFRAVATRYDKRAYVCHGTVTVAAIRLWLHP